MTNLLLSALITRPLHSGSSPPIFIPIIAFPILYTPRGAVQPSNRPIPLPSPCPGARRAAYNAATTTTHTARAAHTAHHAGRTVHAPRRDPRERVPREFHGLVRTRYPKLRYRCVVGFVRPKFGGSGMLLDLARRGTFFVNTGCLKSFHQ